MENKEQIKKELIAEIAVIGCARTPKAHTAQECAECEFIGRCNAYKHAEALYNKGYRMADEVCKYIADLDAEIEKLKTEREARLEKAFDHNEDECKRCMERVEARHCIALSLAEDCISNKTAKAIFERLKPQTHQGVDMGGFFVEIRLHMHDLIWLETEYGVKVVI